MLGGRPCSWVEVDLGRLKNNYSAICRMIGGGEVIAVVKSNAYGHGDTAVAAALYEAGVRSFAVASIDEAIRLRTVLNFTDCSDCEILVLGYTPPSYAEELYIYGITQTLLSEEYAEALASGGFKVRCHLAVDTGMKRIGVMPDAVACRELIRKFKGRLDITGIFTHLACADGESVSDLEFTQRQIGSFLSVADAVGDGSLSLHCLNSAGVLYHRNGIDSRLLSRVRVGIALYGLSPRADGVMPEGIAPALEWKTVVASVRNVQRGEGISYGRSFVAPHDMRIATLPVGYADGYPRELSSLGVAAVCGGYAPVVGRVCMNQMMIDVTDVPNAKMGDEVTLIGSSGAARVSADMLAERAGKINYDILTGIASHIPRIYNY